MNWGEEAQRRLGEIAQCSEPGDGVSRFPFTSHHKAALVHIVAWMRAAGLDPVLDAAATMVGRSPMPGPPFLVGSHQDSVRRGGRYDGIMGVVIGCLALEKLRREGAAPAVPVEVLAFADEEGVRFPTALLGPRALAGTYDPAVLEMSDRDGMGLRMALSEFGGAPGDIPSLKRRPEDVLGYLEVHIEQGPVLETAGLPLGAVSGICGIERNETTFSGETGHAGTVPMDGRRDALVASAAFISQINEAAQDFPELRATIGTLRLSPDVVNAIPDKAEMTLEIRALDDGAREAFRAAVEGIGAEVAESHGTPFEMRRTYLQPAVPCGEALTGKLEAAVRQVTGASTILPSGATHDASAMADLCPVSMMFVRCRGGISHRPDEFASVGDMTAAVEATACFLASLH